MKTVEATEIVKYKPPTVGKHGGGIFMVSLTLTLCYLALNVFAIYWCLNKINFLDLFSSLLNYTWATLILVFEYFRDGGPIRHYSCTGGSTEEEIICQIKAGCNKFYRTMFLTHLLKYVTTFFDTTNFFNVCASLWILFGVSKSIIYRSVSLSTTKLKEIIRPIIRFSFWYSYAVFINIENAIGGLYGFRKTIK